MNRPIRTLTGIHRLLLVVGGYGVATLLAFAAVRVYVAATPAVDRQGAAGMSAFGDGMLFLGALALTSAPVSCFALYSLRPYALFWRGAVTVALLVNSTALVAFVGALPSFRAATSWSGLSPLRVLIAPILAFAFLLCALFAPHRRQKLAFLAAVLVEGLVFGSVISMWLWFARHPPRASLELGPPNPSLQLTPYALRFAQGSGRS